MTYLLDSNALLWAVYFPEKLTEAVRQLLADTDYEFLVSHASLWEVLTRVASGKLLLAGNSVDEALLDIKALGFTMLPITETHLLAAARLPGIHFDPFDRMLIAQAMEQRVAMISSDRLLSRYGVSVVPA